MTDHNAEAGKKVEACAWCGKGPEVEPEPVLYDIEFCQCRCPLAFSDSLTIGDWNDMQRRILEQRRKDFEAGQESMLGPGEFVDTSVAMSFDDYLARCRK